MAFGYFTPQENLPLRQKIALAMLMQRNQPARNLGEGLQSASKSIMDALMMRDLLEQDKAAQAVALGTPAAPAAPAAPSAYSPPTQTSPQPVTPVSGDAGPAGLGTPMEYAPDAYNPLDQASDLRDQRANYTKQLDADPAAKMTMAGLMSAEEGPGAANSTARQKLAETIFNRGASRGVTDVNKVMDPRYYQPMMPGQSNSLASHVARLNADPAYKAQVFGEIDQVGKEGTNYSNLATDNASGAVAANSMRNQTLTSTSPNGESFFRKDIRPDVHGAGVVPQTAAWANRLAVGQPQSATDISAQSRGPAMAFSGEPSDATTFNAQNFLPGAAPRPAGMAPALASTSPAPPQIQQAPAPPIRQAPVQVAQAGPPQAGQPGYIPPLGPEPQPPPAIQPTQEHYDLAKKVGILTAANPYYANSTDAQRLNQMNADLADRQKKQDEKYKNDLQIYRANQQEKYKLQAGQGQAIAAGQKAQSEAATAATDAAIVQRTGMNPREFYDRMDKEKSTVENIIKAQNTQQLARSAIKAGVVTGYGANMRVARDKIAAWAFDNNLKGDEASNTEVLQNALRQGLRAAVTTVNGPGGTGVSNTDVRIAEGLIGSDINLQMKTIQRIMDQAAEINYAQINAYEHKVGRYLGGTAAEDFYKPALQVGVPSNKLKIFEESQRQDDPAEAARHRALVDRTYGPGTAEYMIARLRRQGKLKDTQDGEGR